MNILVTDIATHSFQLNSHWTPSSLKPGWLLYDITYTAFPAPEFL